MPNFTYESEFRFDPTNVFGHMQEEFPAKSAFDVVIIGAGPNGLIAGAYLAKAGLSVALVERRFEAGGGLATALFGARAGKRDVISFDMGGTTAKACLIEDGRAEIAPEMEAGRVHRFKKGSGLPIKAPAMWTTPSDRPISRSSSSLTSASTSSTWRYACPVARLMPISHVRLALT